jgi:hypothetical protein
MASTSKQSNVCSEKDDIKALLPTKFRSSLDSEIYNKHGEISN